MNPKEFYDDALKIVYNISLSNVHICIFHAGFGFPSNLDNTQCDKYFSNIHYLCLYCSEEEIQKRLIKRMKDKGEELNNFFIENMKRFNDSYKNYDGKVKFDKLDTINKNLEESSIEVI